MIHFFKNRTKSNKDQLSEDALIQGYRESENIAFIGELFDPYIHLIYGLCMKYLKNEEESNDAVMQIFENSLNDLKTQEIKNFKNWIYIVSKNYCLKIIRRQKQNLKYIDASKANNSIRFMEIEDDLNLIIDDTLNKKNEALYNAIKQLKGPQRECIELFYLQEKSYKEVVEITGFEMKKVKSYVQNGKRNLRIKLNDLNND